MQFSKDLTIADLALGLTLMIGHRFKTIDALDGIREELLNSDHDSIYANAEIIAARYGLHIRVEQKTFAEIEDSANDCFITGMTPMGELCGAYIDGAMMIPSFAYDYPQPSIMNVFMSIPATKH